jgi:hypothetical protein
MNESLAGDDFSRNSLDLSDEAERRSLSPAAWKFFRRVVHIWNVPEREALRLLGLAPGTNLDDFDSARLSAEQLMRVSYLVGIFGALHILYRAALADQWVSLPNTNAMFGGQAPLTYMVNGGIDALRNVRKLLDARCAGNF